MRPAFQVAVLTALRELRVDVSYAVAVRVLALLASTYVGALVAIVAVGGGLDPVPAPVGVGGETLPASGLLAGVLALAGGLAAVSGVARHRARVCADRDRRRLHAARSALGCDALAVVTVDRLGPSALRALAAAAVLVAAALSSTPVARLLVLAAAGVATTLLLWSWHTALRGVLTSEPYVVRPVLRALRLLTMLAVGLGVGAVVRGWDRSQVVIDLPVLPVLLTVLGSATTTLWLGVRTGLAAQQARAAPPALPVEPVPDLRTVAEPSARSRTPASVVARAVGRALVAGAERAGAVGAVACFVLVARVAPPAVDPRLAAAGLAVAACGLLSTASAEPDLMWSGRAVRTLYEHGWPPWTTWAVFTVTSAAWAAPSIAALTVMLSATAGMPAVLGAVVGAGAVAAHALGRAVLATTWAAPTDFALMAASTLAIGTAVAVALLADPWPALVGATSVLLVAAAVWTRRTRYR